MILGISPTWLSGQQCLFLSRYCGALWIIKPLFACWTCMGKGQKLLSVTPFFLRETKVVLLTMRKMNVLALRGEKPKSQNDRQMKQGRLSSITQRYNIFWFIHEKKQIMCASLPHCTHTFWISTEEKKKSQTNNFFFCLMLCRLSKWWCYVVLTCSDGPLNFIKRSSLKEFLSCVMIQ